MKEIQKVNAFPAAENGISTAMLTLKEFAVFYNADPICALQLVSFASYIDIYICQKCVAKQSLLELGLNVITNKCPHYPLYIQ